MSLRPVREIVSSTPTVEGAGVRLRRAFGFGNTDDFDPFLLLDDFRSDRSEDYIRGFPWHPHRGIETITYILDGLIEHKDSLGNSGSLGAGDVQWMTAGSGIIHQEMPKGSRVGKMHGFQLWANLPAALKMTNPHYQDRSAGDVPEVVEDDGTKARIICGELWGRAGAVDGIAASPNYFDITVPAGLSKSIKIDVERNAFAYIFDGDASFDDASAPFGVLTEEVGASPDAPPRRASDHSLVLFDSGDEIRVNAGDHGVRFLLVSGKPIREPVAWRGPIVMNTDSELSVAFDELQRGNFLKEKSAFA